MFEKTVKYIRENLQLPAERLNGTYCSRLHKDQVYYMSEKILKLAPISDFPGTCFRKFTKTYVFQVHITALDYPAPYAKGFGVAATSMQDCRKGDPTDLWYFIKQTLVNMCGTKRW
ncbi:60S ribosome subunit biogenesis protein NIP7 homolog isoform X2 [Hylobates moloch]|nr:60S ribosome subunit biogenesis protein NIP7 homolog isoform X2 [Hylobates moloch]